MGRGREESATPFISWLTDCFFTSTETVGLLGTGAQDGHLDFHTVPELCLLKQPVECTTDELSVPPAEQSDLVSPLKLNTEQQGCKKSDSGDYLGCIGQTRVSLAYNI